MTPDSKVWHLEFRPPPQATRTPTLGTWCPACTVGVTHGLELVKKDHLGFPKLFMQSSHTIQKANNSSEIH